jgi:molybdopterin converting factor small subunit
MNVNLKCFSALVDPDKCDFRESKSYTLTDGQTVEDLVTKAGVEKKDVKIVFVNSKKVDFEKRLTHGDQVGLAPATGGM